MVRTPTTERASRTPGRINVEHQAPGSACAQRPISTDWENDRDIITPTTQFLIIGYHTFNIIVEQRITRIYIIKEELNTNIEETVFSACLLIMKIHVYSLVSILTT